MDTHIIQKNTFSQNIHASKGKRVRKKFLQIKEERKKKIKTISIEGFNFEKISHKQKEKNEILQVENPRPVP